MEKAKGARIFTRANLEKVFALVVIAVSAVVLAVSLVALTSGGLPSVFGKTIYLNTGGNVGEYQAGELLTLSDTEPGEGDVVVYKKNDSYLLGKVALVTEKKGKSVVAVLADDENNAVIVLPISAVQGKVTGSVLGLGQATAFLGKYKTAFIILFISVALIELFDVFACIQKRTNDSL